MLNMALVSTTSRRLVIIRMTWVMASLLFVFGSWLIGQGAWIHLKAVSGQWLLQQAWHTSLNTHLPVKPWPWADTWPVGRLVIPRLGINQIILSNASGQSLAFGPGRMRKGNFSDAGSQSPILSGHRDTHFSFMQDIQLGDTILVQTPRGDWQRLVANNIEVVDSRTQPLTANVGPINLRLITCYPFDAIQPGGPLRYVVSAQGSKRKELNTPRQPPLLNENSEGIIPYKVVP